MGFGVQGSRPSRAGGAVGPRTRLRGVRSHRSDADVGRAAEPGAAARPGPWACLVEVEDQVQLAHVAEEVVQDLDEQVDGLETHQLVVTRVQA